MRAKLQECRSHSAKILVLPAVFLLAAFTFAEMAEARSFLVYNTSAPAQAYFIVNGTTGYAGAGLLNPAYPLDVSGAGRFSGDLYLGTSGRYVYDTGSIIGVSSGLLLGGNLDLGGYSIVSGGWLNGTNINATGIYGATLYESGTALSSKYALQSTSISSGSGLSGGGDLSAARTLSIANGGVTNIMIAAGTVNKTQISGVLDSTIVGSLYGENITAGTISSARVSGVYSSITGIGTQAQNLDMGGYNITNYNYLAANDSAKLNGQSSSYYLDTSSTAQTKSGSLAVTGAWLNATNLSVSSNGYFGGNVGIGTTSPIAKLDLGINNRLFLGGNTNSWGWFINVTDYSGGNVPLIFEERNTGVNTERMRIAQGGNVGIGTVSPQNTLNVVGDANITGDFLYGCPNTATNQMVKVGSFCIDKYEAYTVSGSLGNANGNNTNAVAGSKSGVLPQASVTWFQAAQECANAGKRLCTNAEWQTAVAGTPDPGADGGLTGCNVASRGTPNTTGYFTACVSRWGAYDMVGNVWEWVADWGQAGWTWQTSDGQYTNTAWSSDYGADGTWNVNGRTYNGAAWVSGAPTAFLRGGYWVNGADAGSFALLLSDAPSSSSAAVGFRCCK